MRPRIRSVKPEMRRDERYGRLSIPARELFNGLITMADDEGRFRALTSAIVGDVFPFDDPAPAKIKAWVKEIQDSGMVLFYKDGSTPYGAFRHWAKHQKINRPTPSELPEPPDPKVAKDNSIVRTDKGWRQWLSLKDQDGLTESSVSLHDVLTEAFVTTHEGLSESSISTRVGACRSDPILISSLLNSKEFQEPQRVLLLSALLAAWIVRNDPKVDVDPESPKWCSDMRLLLADRKGDVAEIVKVIDFCGQDTFEQTNVLSPGKLRARFTGLLLKARGVTPIRGERRIETGAEYAARRSA